MLGTRLLTHIPEKEIQRSPSGELNKQVNFQQLWSKVKHTSARVEAAESCSGEISTRSGCLSERRSRMTADKWQTRASSIWNFIRVDQLLCATTYHSKQRGSCYQLPHIASGETPGGDHPAPCWPTAMFKALSSCEQSLRRGWKLRSVFLLHKRVWREKLKSDSLLHSHTGEHSVFVPWLLWKY